MGMRSWIGIGVLAVVLAGAGPGRVSGAILLGGDSADTFKGSFFAQRTNADRIIEGLNLYGTLPLNGVAGGLPASARFKDLRVTNGNGDLVLSNGNILVPTNGVVTNGAGGGWSFGAEKSNRVARLGEVSNIVNAATSAVPALVTNIVTNLVAGAAGSTNKVEKTGDTLSGTFTAQEGMKIYHADGDGASGEFSFGLGTNANANTVSRVGATETLRNKTLESPVLSSNVNVGGAGLKFAGTGGEWNWLTGTNTDTNTVPRKGYVDEGLAGKLDLSGGALNGELLVSGGDIQIMDGFLYTQIGILLGPDAGQSGFIYGATNPYPIVVVSDRLGFAPSVYDPPDAYFWRIEEGLMGLTELDIQGTSPFRTPLRVRGWQNQDVPLTEWRNSTNGMVASVGAAGEFYGWELDLVGKSNGVARWVSSRLQSGATTDDLPEGGSRQYFTEGRVRGSVLTGIVNTNGGQVTSGDTVLSGLGKLENRVSALATNAAQLASTSYVAAAVAASTNGLIENRYSTNRIIEPSLVTRPAEGFVVGDSWDGGSVGVGLTNSWCRKWTNALATNWNLFRNYAFTGADMTKVAGQAVTNVLPFLQAGGGTNRYVYYRLGAENDAFEGIFKTNYGAALGVASNALDMIDTNGGIIISWTLPKYKDMSYDAGVPNSYLREVYRTNVNNRLRYWHEIGLIDVLVDLEAITDPEIVAATYTYEPEFDEWTTNRNYLHPNDFVEEMWAEELFKEQWAWRHGYIKEGRRVGTLLWTALDGKLPSTETNNYATHAQLNAASNALQAAYLSALGGTNTQLLAVLGDASNALRNLNYSLELAQSNNVNTKLPSMNGTAQSVTLGGDTTNAGSTFFSNNASIVQGPSTNLIERGNLEITNASPTPRVFAVWGGSTPLIMTTNGNVGFGGVPTSGNKVDIFGNLSMNGNSIYAEIYQGNFMRYIATAANKAVFCGFNRNGVLLGFGTNNNTAGYSFGYPGLYAPAAGSGLVSSELWVTDQAGNATPTNNVRIFGSEFIGQSVWVSNKANLLGGIVTASVAPSTAYTLTTNDFDLWLQPGCTSVVLLAAAQMSNQTVRIHGNDFAAVSNIYVSVATGDGIDARGCYQTAKSNVVLRFYGQDVELKSRGNTNWVATALTQHVPLGVAWPLCPSNMVGLVTNFDAGWELMDGHVCSDNQSPFFGQVVEPMSTRYLVGTTWGGQGIMGDETSTPVIVDVNQDLATETVYNLPGGAYQPARISMLFIKRVK